MKRIQQTLAALAASLLAATALAHNPLEHPEWCNSGGRIVIVDEFNWTGDELARWVREREEDARGDDGSCPASAEGGGEPGLRFCGQFDDDWLQAFRLSSAHCDQFAVSYEYLTDPDQGSVVAIATGPDEFLDPDNHHELYHLVMGLRGACVRCEPTRIRPVRPGAPTR